MSSSSNLVSLYSRSTMAKVYRDSSGIETDQYGSAPVEWLLLVSVSLDKVFAASYAPFVLLLR
jgi:hypothetical protein